MRPSMPAPPTVAETSSTRLPGCVGRSNPTLITAVAPGTTFIPVLLYPSYVTNAVGAAVEATTTAAPATATLASRRARRVRVAIMGKLCRTVGCAATVTFRSTDAATRHERTAGMEVLSATRVQVALRIALAAESHCCRHEAPQHGESRQGPEGTLEARACFKGVGGGDDEAARRPVEICRSRLHGSIVGYGTQAAAVFADLCRQPGFL